MSKAIKIIFPFGMFFVLFIVFSAISSGITGYLYYNQLMSNIDKSIKDAKEISSSITHASTDIAELSSGQLQKDRLNSFFDKNKKNGFFTKAFYVLENGTLVAHSNSSEIERLGGNIAADEFQYNLDQIFYCIKENKKDIYFSDYYLIEEKIPFTKQEIFYIKKYIYDKIDRNGWLSSKAIEKNVKISKEKFKSKKIGTVNFIISKKPLYNNILKTKESLIQTEAILLAICAALSLFIGIIVYIRYIMISNKATKTIQLETRSEYTPPENIDINVDPKERYDTYSEYPEKDIDIKADDYFSETTFSEVSPRNLKAIDDVKEPNIQIVYDEEDEDAEDSQIVIQDAIPVNKRRTG